MQGHAQGALSNLDHSHPLVPTLLRYRTSPIALVAGNLSKLYIYTYIYMDMGPAQRPETRKGARKGLKVGADSRGRTEGTVGSAEAARTTNAQGFVSVKGLKRGVDRCSACVYGLQCSSRRLSSSRTRSLVRPCLNTKLKLEPIFNFLSAPVVEPGSKSRWQTGSMGVLIGFRAYGFRV